MACAQDSGASGWYEPPLHLVLEITGLGMLLTVVTLTLTPRPPRINLPLLSWDKSQHCIAYAGL